MRLTRVESWRRAERQYRRLMAVKGWRAASAMWARYYQWYLYNQ